MSLGTYRRIERIQPGWLVACGPEGEAKDPEADEWCEVLSVMQGGPVVVIDFTDGSRAGGHVGQELRVLTNGEKRQRRLALGGAS